MAILEGLEFYISKRVGRAIMDYKMLADGDKIAVAVSGGKDSLTLLRILQARQKFVPIKYDLLALHVDLGKPRLSKQLEKYLEKQQVKYHISKSCELKELFQVAHKLGCNKIALGHHKDDIVQTILMNLFLQGEISAMKPKQELPKSKIIVIRPLAYVEESMIKKFAKEEKLPHGASIRSNSVISNRAKIAKIIRALEKTCPEVKTNIFRSLQRIKHDYLL